MEKTDLSAYRSVLSVCSQQLRPGEIIAIYNNNTEYIIDVSVEKELFTLTVLIKNKKVNGFVSK